jgi:hypothetical protein
MNMIECQVYPKCGCLIRKILIKKLDSSLIIGFYCDKSILFYSEFDESKLESTEFFKIKILIIYSCVN